MLSDLFQPYDCTITGYGLSNPNTVIVSYKLKCKKLNLEQDFSWARGQDRLEDVLKGRVSKFVSVLANGSKLDNRKVYDRESLLGFIDENYVRLTPDLKLSTILEFIGHKTSYDGQAVAMQTPHALELARLYFSNGSEWRFYIDSAVQQGLVTKKQRLDENRKPTSYHDYALTVAGLSRLISVTESKNSRYCFIAMSFTDDMFAVLEQAIKPTLIACGFEALVVNEVHQDSDKTINDAILACIKKSRFTIADFTHLKAGVYFEAGYALGRGQKVIYSCREDFINDVHFDLRNYQHIVWKGVDDFKTQLKNKIEAFVID